MSVDQMFACSDASDSEAEAGLPYSDSLGGCPYSEGGIPAQSWRGSQDRH